MKVVSSIIAILTSMAAAAPARSAPTTRSAERHELTVDATATPTPALKYRLMPQFAEQMPGNAAPLYLIAGMTLPREDQDPQLLDVLEQTPLNKDDARKVLTRYRVVFGEIEIASLREHCDWNLSLREQGFDARLPQLNRLRAIENALMLKARLHIADGQYDQAIATLRTGFAVSQHLHDQSTLVQALVETGAHSALLHRVPELQQAPGAPNLYWALANLPHPLIDAQLPMQVEQAMARINFAALRDRPVEQLSPDELREVFHRIWELSNYQQTGQNSTNELEFAVTMVSAYEDAKRQMIQQGRSPQEVQNLPVQTVLAPYLLNDYLHFSDNAFKWAGLPFWQANEGVRQAMMQIKSQENLQSNPLMKLLPAVDRALSSFARLERQLAWVQTVEALRAYAATHDHKLPASLDELTDTPAPLDAMTGKPFGYEVHDKTATLHAPAIADYAPEVIVQVTIR